MGTLVLAYKATSRTVASDAEIKRNRAKRSAAHGCYIFMPTTLISILACRTDVRWGRATHITMVVVHRHNEALLPRLLGLKDVSPFILILDSLAQSADPFIREFLHRVPEVSTWKTTLRETS